MNGISVVRLLDVLRVNTVRNAPGVAPRSLIVQGQDFQNVETVLINGSPAPEFMVYAKNELIAQVPDIHRDALITEVSVLSSQLTLTDRSLVTFTFGARPKKIQGVLRLMQTFLRILLRTPGSNVFHRRSGGGMLARVGTNISPRAAADIAVAINTTKTYLIGVQTAERNLPPNERLLNAEITNLNVDERNTTISVTIVLTNHSGQRTAATLTA
jgi:hypothetical protein